MKAEREEIAPARKPKAEPRLAYEIALGIFIGGIALLTVESVAGYIIAKIAMQQIRIGL